MFACDIVCHSIILRVKNAFAHVSLGRYQDDETPNWLVVLISVLTTRELFKRQGPLIELQEPHKSLMFQVDTSRSSFY